MSFKDGRRLAFLLLLILTSTGCTDEFYLSEKEVAAYRTTLATETAMNLNFGNLQGHQVTLQFDNSTGSPLVSSTNLTSEMRTTGLANLETGPAAISLDRAGAELEKQLNNWITGRLQLGDGVHTTWFHFQVHGLCQAFFKTRLCFIRAAIIWSWQRSIRTMRWSMVTGVTRHGAISCCSPQDNGIRPQLVTEENLLLLRRHPAKPR